MGDINTNIRIDQLQTVVKAIAGRGGVRTKVTTFYPASSGDAFSFSPDPDAILTAWSTSASSSNQMYGGINAGPLIENVNYSMAGSNLQFGYWGGQLTFYFAAPGGFTLLEIMVDSETT